MDNKIYEDVNEGVLRQVGCGMKILDVGCSTGTLGAEIKRKGNTVWGLDVSEKAVAIAKDKLDKVFVCDVEDHANLPIHGEQFDVIVYADILEHLTDPLTTLREYKRFLKEDGFIVVSLPNIASWTIRVKKLFGPLKPSKYGILDETHKHFYDLKGAKKLVEEGGYRIETIDVNPNIVRSVIPSLRKILNSEESGQLEKNLLESKTYKIYRKIVLPLELIPTRKLKSLLAFQFVIKAKIR